MITYRGFLLSILTAEMFLFLGISLLCAQNVPSSTLFDNYQQNLERYSRVSFSASFTDFFENHPEKKNTLQMRWKIDFETKKCKFEKPLESGDQGDWQSFDESVLYDGKTLSVSVYPKQPEYNTIAVTSYVETPSNYWNQFVRPFYFCYPFGYIILDGELCYIPDMIGTSKKSTKIKDGKLLLTCEADAWKFVITLLPEKNYVAESIHAHRVKPMSDPRVLESFDYVVEHFIEKDGMWFPDRYNVKEVFPEGEYKVSLPLGLHLSGANKDGKVKKKREVLIAEVLFSDIEFPKKITDADFQLTTPIPDYTEVYMQDAPQIKYVWIDGKIEPLTDELAEERLRGHGFTPGTSSQWFSLIVGTAGFLMIVISIGIQIWKKLKKNKDNKKDEDK